MSKGADGSAELPIRVFGPAGVASAFSLIYRDLICMAPVGSCSA